MDNNKSEVARFQRLILEEYEAAQRGLSGFASGVANHAFINARMENMSMIHKQLKELVGPDKAISIVAQTLWQEEDKGNIPSC